MTFGSLFSGIGGIDLGLTWSGMQCVYQCEIELYCRKILAQHWPRAKQYADIRNITGSELESVDLIAGGFPCQDISYAGKGVGLDGARSGLFFELVRVVRQCRPRFVLLENVSALLVRGLDRVLGTLAQIGYDAEWHCLSAAHFGAPHIRDRVFILAYPNGMQRQRNGILAKLVCPSRQTQRKRNVTRNAVGRSRQVVADSKGWRWEENGLPIGEAKEESITGDSSEVLADAYSAWKLQPKESWLKGRQWSCDGSIGTIEDYRRTVGRGQWEIEPSVGRMVDGVPHRVDRVSAIGNAVVPQIAHWIGLKIIEAEEINKGER